MICIATKEGKIPFKKKPAAQYEKQLAKMRAGAKEKDSPKICDLLETQLPQNLSAKRNSNKMLRPDLTSNTQSAHFDRG